MIVLAKDDKLLSSYYVFYNEIAEEAINKLFEVLIVEKMAS